VYHSSNISNNFVVCENNNKQVFEAKNSENDCLIEASKSSEDFPNVEFSNQSLPVHHSSNISNNFVDCENNNKQVFEPKKSENVCLIETLNSSEGFPNVESSTKSLLVFKEKKNVELQAVILNELVENGHEVNFLQSDKERHFPSNEKSGRDEKSFNNRFDCHHCNKAYISRKSLVRHTKTKHRACHRCGESLNSIEKHVCGGKDVQSQTKEKILLTDNEKESGNLISKSDSILSDVKKVTQSQTEADSNHQFENESSSKKAAAGNCK
jgi:transcription elongation factor Elf1